MKGGGGTLLNILKNLLTDCRWGLCLHNSCGRLLLWPGMSDDGGEETTLNSVTSQNNQINLQGPLILLSNHHQSPANLLRQRNVLDLDRRVCWPLSLPLSSYKMSHLTSLESQTGSVSDIWLGPASLSFYWLQVVGSELTWGYRDVLLNSPQFVLSWWLPAGWSHLQMSLAN